MALIWNTGAQSFSKKRANPMLWFTPFLRKINVKKSGCKEIFDIMHLCNPVTLQLKQWTNGSRYNATLVGIWSLYLWQYSKSWYGYSDTVLRATRRLQLVAILSIYLWQYSHSCDGHSVTIIRGFSNMMSARKRGVQTTPTPLVMQKSDITAYMLIYEDLPLSAQR